MNTSRRLNALAAILVMMLPVEVSAQWMQTNGPFGGQIWCFVFAPGGTGDTNLFAGSSGGGVFLSTNNGASWTAASQGLSNGSVATLAVAGNKIFAGTSGGGVFLSSNGGGSWVQASNGLTCLDIWCMAVSGTNLFAGTHGGGIFRSTNEGGSWAAVNGGLKDTIVECISVHGTNLLAGTLQEGVFISSDQGVTWLEVNGGLPRSQWDSTHYAEVSSIVSIGADLFLCADGWIFSSTNGGMAWTQPNPGWGGRILSASGGSLLSSGGGFSLSTDSGTSWAVKDSGLTETYVIALAASGGNIVAATIGGGVFRSTNGGEVWSEANDGMLGVSAKDLVPLTSQGGAQLFVGTDQGIYVSTNGGGNWTSVGAGLPRPSLGSLDVAHDSAGGTTLIAGYAWHGLWLSTDGGSSWARRYTGLTWEPGIWSVVTLGENYIAGTAGGGIIRSTDKGNIWTEDIFGPQGVVCFGLSGTNVFAGASGIYRSSDYGATWEHVINGLSPIPMVYSFAFVPNGSGGDSLCLAATSRGVYRSTNTGQTWTPAGLAGSSVQALFVYGARIFAGTKNEGIFLSADNGTTWNPVNEGIPLGTTVRGFGVFGSDMFLATLGRGIWRRPLRELVTSVGFTALSIPEHFSMAQNYPNPFNSSTTIRYGLPGREHMSLTIFNTLGQQVSVLQNGEQDAGYHEVRFDGATFPSGVYFYRMQAGSFTETRKLLLVR